MFNWWKYEVETAWHVNIDTSLASGEEMHGMPVMSQVVLEGCHQASAE